MVNDKINAVIFDLDGTVLDTLDDLTAAVNVALDAVGFAALEKSVLRKFVGNGIGKMIERALCHCGDKANAHYDRCMRSFTEYYGAHSMDKTALYDGIAQTLESLRSRGIKTAVVTNKYDEAAQKLKKQLFDTVDFVIGARDGVPPKPDPTGERLALAALGSDSKHAIHVGDGEVDITTARNAGLPVVAVTWGFRDREELELFRPDHIIDRPEELIPLLERVGRL